MINIDWAPKATISRPSIHINIVNQSSCLVLRKELQRDFQYSTEYVYGLLFMISGGVPGYKSSKYRH